MSLSLSGKYATINTELGVLLMYQLYYDGNGGYSISNIVSLLATETLEAISYEALAYDNGKNNAGDSFTIGSVNSYRTSNTWTLQSNYRGSPYSSFYVEESFSNGMFYGVDDSYQGSYNIPVVIVNTNTMSIDTVWHVRSKNAYKFETPVSTRNSSNTTSYYLLSDITINVSGVTYPITYHYENSTVSGPSEAAVGDTVTVSAVPDVGYGITDASSQILVTNNDVAVPYTWDAANQRITFTMPDPS